jgi:hypothetical protein
MRKEFSEERSGLNEKVEELKNRVQSVTSEFLERKIEVDKELALSNQQVSEIFLSKISKRVLCSQL